MSFESANKCSAQENVTVDNEEEASSYYRLRRQIELLGRQMNKIILSPKYCLPFLNPGRLVKVRHGKNDFGWGIIMNFKKEKKDVEDEEYRVDVMVNCDKDTVKSTSTDVAKPAKGTTLFILHYYLIFRWH